MAETENKSDMAETKDPAIKLFGMTIFKFKTEDSPDSSIPAKLDNITEKEKIELEFDHVKGSIDKVENQHQVSDNGIIGQMNDNMKVEQEEDKEVEEKFSKPDKILPCPRCNSLETKFCYFNNYNVNQPRHFCRNCQRYWTAGGNMRNVPIGAGRRKNKLLRIEESANSEATHLMRPQEEDRTTHVVPIAPLVYQCNRVLESSDSSNRFLSNGSMIPLQFMPMPCWVWTLGGNGNMNMQPMVGLDMGFDKNGSSRLGKHSRDGDFCEENIGLKTPRRTDEPGKNS